MELVRGGPSWRGGTPTLRRLVLIIKALTVSLGMEGVLQCGSTAPGTPGAWPRTAYLPPVWLLTLDLDMRLADWRAGALQLEPRRSARRPAARRERISPLVHAEFVGRLRRLGAGVSVEAHLGLPATSTPPPTRAWGTAQLGGAARRLGRMRTSAAGMGEPMSIVGRSRTRASRPLGSSASIPRTGMCRHQPPRSE